MNAYTRVKYYCDEKLITFNELEKKCNIPPNTIETWKDTIPEPKYIAKIAMIMHVSPQWLETGKHYNKIFDLEEFIIYILRNAEPERTKKLINTIWDEINYLQDYNISIPKNTVIKFADRKNNRKS